MKIFADREIKRLFQILSLVLIGSLLLTEAYMLHICGKFSILPLIIGILTACAVFAVCFSFFRRQNSIMETAVSRINAYLDGDLEARIDADEEGEMYRLFHSVNSLAAVLNAHAENQLREKLFLKDTISDISHQLKTPLAALNIYNGLLQDEAADMDTVKNFAVLSEQELDRIENLVQNLLKITKLDAGSITLEKHVENVGDMMRDIELHYAYRAAQDGKRLILSGADDVTLSCDRVWLTEAVDNLVKNAFDHTQIGSTIEIEWRARPGTVQINVKDNGCGIHPEDLHHIFKRFYRSRFSKDKQGLGLGLPLSKAIIEAHGGTIEADSELGRGTCFKINFLITTKL